MMPIGKLVWSFSLAFCILQSSAQSVSDYLQSSTENWNAGNYEQAFSDLTQAVTLSGQQYQSDPQAFAMEYANVLNQMGVRLYQADNLETAASYYRAAVPVFQEAQGESGKDFLITLDNLALCLNDMRNYEEAIQVYSYLLSNDTYLSTNKEQLYLTYNSAAICAFEAGQFDLSDTYYERSLELAPQDSPDYWLITENYILLERTKGNYEHALAMIEPFLERFPEKKSQYSNVMAYIFRDQAIATFEAGDYMASIPLYQKTLDLLIPSDSVAQLSIVYAHMDIASAYVNASQYAQGKEAILKYEELAADYYGEDSEEYVLALNSVIVTLSELADYNLVDRYYRKAYRILSNASIQNEGEVMAILDLNYSDLMVKLGRFEEARESAYRAFSFYATDEELYFEQLLISINQLAITLVQLGEYDRAESLLKTALSAQTRKYGLENDMGSKIASNLTTLYLQSGRFSRAYQFAEFILLNDRNLHGSNSMQYAFSLNVVGVLYLSTGLYEEAIETLTQSYEIREPMVGANNRELLVLKESIGMAYMKDGQLDEARRILTEVLNTQRSLTGNRNLDISVTQNDLGMVALMTGDYREAYRYFQSSYEIKKDAFGSFDQFAITSLYNMACAQHLMGNGDQALELFNESTSSYIRGLNDYFPFLSEKERLEFFNTIKGQLGAYLSFLEEQLDDNPALTSEIYNTHIQTKAILLSKSIELRNFLINHPDPQTQETYQVWNAIKTEIAQLEQQQLNEVQSVYLDSIKIAGEEYERTLNSLTNQLEHDEETWQAIAGTLEDGEAAIEIIRIQSFDFAENSHVADQSVYLALIVDNQTTNEPRYVRLANGQAMETTHFNLYKNKITFKLEDADSYGIFWEPIAKELTDYDKVYLSVDGVYNLINLYSLWNPETGNYVLEESNIELLSNTKDLLYSARDNDEIRDAVLFGFPDFNAAPDHTIEHEQRSALYAELFTEGVVDLPGTRVEIENISSLLNESGVTSTVFSAQNADEGQLKNLERVDILHIATHGFFEESSENVVNDDPLLHSGLLMANLKESILPEEENGILTAKEVSNLDLSGTELVVLSACETGKGKIANGEGVYGLQRAFQVAGADHVIISLWKVDDQATQELMTLFYSEYLENDNPHASLRLAQSRLQGEYPHPYYWGAFQVVGKP
jgi:tetratricopeptide (TPR) repeat protein